VAAGKKAFDKKSVIIGDKVLKAERILKAAEGRYERLILVGIPKGSEVPEVCCTHNIIEGRSLLVKGLADLCDVDRYK